MLVVVKGKNLEMTDSLRDYAEQKIGKLDRYLDNVTEASVELSTEQAKNVEDRFVAQVTMFVSGTILRGEEKASDLYAAIDSVTDVMQRQMVRYKERIYGRGKGRVATARIGTSTEEGGVTEEETAEEGPMVVKTKRFAIKPMQVEEAIDQMELLNHDFFVFFNAETEQVEVLYRRRDGNYGLIEPELT